MLKIKRKVWFDVKTTIIRVLLEVLSPNRCQRCGLQGESLCGRCKKYLLETNPSYVVSSMDGFLRIFVGGVKEGMLSEILKQYKYQGRRDLSSALTWKAREALSGEAVYIEEDEAVSWNKMVIVPLPTIRKHIRERGFDHMLMLTQELCNSIDGLRMEPVLVRLNKTVQVGKSAKVRREQAKQAYGVQNGARLEGDVAYLLFDDVWTTGASMQAAAEALRQAGAKKISALVLMSNDYIGG